MKASIATLAAISATFIGSAGAMQHRDGNAMRTLEESRVQVGASGELSLKSFEPINFGQVKKIEESTIMLMASTKCCATGTIGDWERYQHCMAMPTDPICG